ncbi:MAG: WXG100 family type VII secretion target [Anaerolineae bacterium]|jgi:WXG100 family type VII secretion target|nr:WXG100 family type VII secretion target [Anaerolineae bacterium]
MSDRVEADYQELQKLSNQMNQRADEIQQQFQALKAKTGELLNGNWEGRGADKFQNEMEGEVFPSLQKLQRALEMLSKSLGQVANAFRQSEEQASNLFKG